jgi:regulatory protein
MPLLAPLSLKGRALRLLSGREHSRAELERKLADHEEQPGQLARILDELQARDFINEQRVVDSVVHRRAAKLGAMRIRQELMSKGLDAGKIHDALAQLRPTELSRAQEVWGRRFDALPRDAAERGKQARFLMSRGFSAEIASRLLSGKSVEHTNDA